MLHPHTELRFISPEIGYGVFATAPIPRGTIIWVRDELDQEFTSEQLAQLPPAYNEIKRRYTFLTSAATHLLCWDGGRLMNHSCQPTCAGTQGGFEVVLRDLAPGDELTNDYATLHLIEAEHFHCNCNDDACRGVITSAAARDIEATLAQQLQAALSLVQSQPQPLWSLLKPAQIEQVLATGKQ